MPSAKSISENRLSMARYYKAEKSELFSLFRKKDLEQSNSFSIFPYRKGAGGTETVHQLSAKERH